jgi:hypothetical protein
VKLLKESDGVSHLRASLCCKERSCEPASAAPNDSDTRRWRYAVFVPCTAAGVVNAATGTAPVAGAAAGALSDTESGEVRSEEH